VELSASPGSIRHRAPLLGEHTEQVLAELGYSEADVAELHRGGVV
jgi:crotonobetainyl-CoA:carnitine CoA-transferase CaiB-like acyl-CoA transferase